MIGTVAPNLFDRLALAFGRATKATNPAMGFPQPSAAGAFPISWPGWAEWEKKHGDDSQDYARAKVAATSPWVFSDITAIANEASVATLQIKKRDASAEGESDIQNHLLELIWEAPNPFMGRQFLTSFWIWQRLLSGKSFLFWVPNTAGEIAECWPVPAFMMRAHPHPTKFIDYYTFKGSAGADPIKVDAKHITYSRIPHPFDLRDGLSPLAAIYDDMEADLAMGRWNKTFFSKENAAPTGLIVVPRETLDSDLQRVRAEIMDFFSNSAGRRVGVARAGDMDWKPFDRSQKDMEFLEGRRFIRSEIDRVFGFPEGYWAKDATRANSEGAKATMIENAVWPHLVALAEDLNAQTIPLWFGKDVRATFDDIRPRNRALELEEFKTYSAVKTVDELRAMIGDKPIGDVRGLMLVKEIEKGTPLPATPASDKTEETIAAMEEEAGTAEAEPDDASAATPEDAETPPEDDGGEPALEVFSKSADLERWQRKAIKRLKDKGSAAAPFASPEIAPETHEAVTAALKSAQTPDEVRAAFHPFAVKAGETPAERALATALRKALGRLEADALAAIQAGDVPALEALEQALRAELQPAMVAAVLEGMTAQSAALGVGFDPAQATALAQRWAASYVPGAVRGMADTTRDVLAGAIQQYRADPSMTRADLLRLVGGAFSPGRAEMIATTELGRAASQAAVQTNAYLRAAGLTYEYVWNTANDDRNCPICKPLNGTVVPETDLPPKHPRCRCFVTQRLKK